MIVVLALALGAITGALKARKRGGNKLDMAQYAAGYAIAFGLIGLIITIAIGRLI
ncbi:MAG: hypothetical protein AAFQ66_12000 [Pseudomonadota bacterium]